MLQLGHKRCCNWATKGAATSDEKQGSDSKTVRMLKSLLTAMLLRITHSIRLILLVTQLKLHRHFYSVGAGVIEEVRLQRDKGLAILDILFTWKARSTMDESRTRKHTLKVVIAMIWTIMLPIFYSKTRRKYTCYSTNYGIWFGEWCYSTYMLMVAFYLMSNVVNMILFSVPAIGRYIGTSNSGISSLLAWWTQIKPLIGPTRQIMTIGIQNTTGMNFFPRVKNNAGAIAAIWAPVIMLTYRTMDLVNAYQQTEGSYFDVVEPDPQLFASRHSVHFPLPDSDSLKEKTLEYASTLGPVKFLRKEFNNIQDIKLVVGTERVISAGTTTRERQVQEHMQQRELEANAREEAREGEWQRKMNNINSMLDGQALTRI
ncbi:hypothetical protein Tco_1175805 [Tanacetum coccineum]